MAAGYTLAGAPTVIARIDKTDVGNAQIAARLWDVDPATQRQRLVARTVYRPQGTGAFEVFQLHANAYRFAPGHTAKLELLGADVPYARQPNGAFTITVYAICAKNVTATIRGTYIGSSSGTATCAAGELTTGGGVGTDAVNLMYVARSEPSPNNGIPNGWNGHVRYRADGAGASGTVYAICAKPPAAPTPSPSPSPSPAPSASPSPAPGPSPSPSPSPAPAPAAPTTPSGPAPATTLPVSVDAIPPGKTRGRQPTRTVRVAGADIKLRVPRRCIRPTAAFTPKLSVDRRRGDRFVKIARVDYFVGSTRVSIDRDAPFSVRLVVRSTQGGMTYGLRTRLRIKVRGGGTIKRSLSVRFKVCAS